jgi:hypothetical protein
VSTGKLAHIPIDEVQTRRHDDVDADEHENQLNIRT